jgi:serine/threonine-protein kinase
VSSPVETLVGTLVDNRYRIVELLGEGGMGRVYAAEHLKLGKRVAFKVVRSDLAGNGELAVRFAREAMTTSVIEHPNVVSAIDYGSLPGRGAYLVMELARGPSLAELLEQHGTLHWSRAAELGAQIADALSAAHRKRIVHRDLKPDNVVVQRREDGGDLVKILDFGVARWVGASLPPAAGRRSARPAPAAAPSLTHNGMVIGTPGYMAPEQATGDPADFGTDLYALGVVLWESIVGRHPFEGDDLRAILRAQLRGALPTLREATGDQTIPEELDMLVARLCSVLPEDRPSDAGTVRDVLRRVSQRATANAPPSPREMAITGGERMRTPLSSSSVRSPSRWSRRGVVALVLGALSVVTGAFALIWTDQLEVKPQGTFNQAVETLADEARRKGPAPAPAGVGRPAGDASIPLPVRAAGPAVAVATPPIPDALEEAEVQARVQAALLAAQLEPAVDDAAAPWAQYVDVLVVAEGHAARLLAAESLLALAGRGQTEVPAHARALAALQTADGCEALQAALDDVLEATGETTGPAAGTASVTAALEQARRHPESLCGPAREADCRECLLPRLERDLPTLRIRLATRARP